VFKALTREALIARVLVTF